MTLLSVENLVCHYHSNNHSVQALDQVNLGIQSGETIGIVGESGSGKTTIALNIMGLLPDNVTRSGRILFNGVDLMTISRHEIDTHRWKDIAIVFQNSLEVFNPVMKVGTQVIEPMMRHENLNGSDAASRCLELFRMVGLEPQWSECYPHQLSGGMRQRVLLAMALSCNPQVLILDEVTSALDAFTRKEIQELLMGLQKKNGFSMMVISHDISFVSSLSTRMIVLYSGRVVESGPTHDIINDPRHPYTRGLIHSTPDIFVYKDMWGIPGELLSSEDNSSGCPFHKRCTQSADICSKSQPSLQECSISRYVACHRGGVATLMKANGICFSYQLPDHRELRALDNVSLEVREGEVLAIVGQTGSGKSTLAHILAGIMPPVQGEVRFRDQNIKKGRWGNHLHGIQIVFQDPFNSTNSRFSVLQAVKEPLDINGIGNCEERLEMVKMALTQVHLPPTDHFLQKYCAELSGGQRQRVALARAMIMQPKLLIADEITSALDVSTAANVMRLLKGLQNRRGFAMIYISHDLTLTLKIADRIAVMNAGKIVEQGNTHDVMLSPQNEYTRRLISSRIGLCCHIH